MKQQRKRFRKRASVLVLACLVGMQTLCATAFARTEYLADDNFRTITTDAVSPVGAWDVDRSGGDIVYSLNEGIVLKDTERNASIVMSRDICAVSGGEVTFEAVFQLQNRAEGFCFQVGNGEEFVAKIVTDPEKLRLYTAGLSGYQELCAYSGGAYPSGLFGVKLRFDLTAGTLSVWVNGEKYADAVSVGTGKTLNKIIISTPKKRELTAHVCAVKAYRGYSLNERFLTAGTSGVPANWTSEGTAALEKLNSASAPDLYSLGLESGASAKTGFSAIDGDAIYRWAFCIASGGAASFDWTGESGASLFSLNAADGKLSVGETEVGDYVGGIWYDLQLNVNQASGAAELLLNGRSPSWTGSLSGTAITGFSASADSGKLLLDDILAYEDNGDAVPAVTKAESAEADVGMIRCDIWREGSHIGWDAVTPFADERKPYLGYYDDGNVLVSEWESKWMAEHGVDWQLHCWFLPRPYEGGAIKTPNNAFSLEEGYLRSENSQYIDFAILWENSTATDVTEEMFRNNIVPYWIEHYIKDSRYKTVDGKPFISIFDASTFLSSVGGGDVSKAKENIHYLKWMVGAAVGKEALVFCTDTALSNVSDWKDMGFDGIHAYNWRDNTNEAETQKGYFDRAAANCNTAGIGFVPTVSGGIEETPWGRPAGARLSPENFKSVLEYAKEKGYYNSKKLVLLDSWNEIAEGHYLQPTAKDGFDYLDAIRSVTVGEETHTDTLPSEAEKAKLGTLYPQDRKPNPAGTVDVPVGSTAVKSWTGTALDDWEKGTQVASLELANGVLKGSASGIDPTLFVSELSLDLEAVNHLKITLKRTCSDALVKVYYITTNMEDQSKYQEACSAYAYAGKSGEEETIYVSLYNAKDFGGTLKSLRVDPINSVGSFEISEIALMKNTDTELKKLYVNGEAKDDFLKIPLQEKNETIYIDYFALRDVFGLKSSYVAAEEAIVFTDAGKRFVFAKNGTLSGNGETLGSFAPLETAGDTYILPIAAVAEALGYEAAVDDAAGTVSLTAKRFYPEATYDATAASEKDEQGLWLYRNLAPDPDCTDVSKFWKQSERYSNDTNNVTLSQTGHTGSSVYKEFTEAWKRMGFPAELCAEDRLYFSAWMKNETGSDSGKNMWIALDCDVYRDNEKMAENSATQLASAFKLTDSWQYITQTAELKSFKKGSELVSFGDTYSVKNANFYITQSAAQEKTVYLDDINLRWIPEFAVYTKSVSHDSYATVGAEPIEFVFSCDIDPFTVTADKISINGAACTEETVRTELVTNESTRETRLRIFLLSGTEGEKLAVSLPDITDAWGRAIRGATGTTATYSPKSAPAYVDENGSFLYDLSDITDTGYSVFAAAYGENDVLLDVTLAEIANGRANGTLSISGACEVRFYVWKMGEAAAMQPLKEETHYTIK